MPVPICCFPEVADLAAVEEQVEKVADLAAVGEQVEKVAVEEQVRVLS